MRFITVQFFETRRLSLIAFFATAMFLISGINCARCADEILDGDKVLVLMIYDTHCTTWCKQVRPIMAELKTEYAGKVSVVELDFTENVMKQSFETAKQYGVSNFCKQMIDYIPTVGVFTPKRKLVKELPAVTKKETYVKSIEKALNSG